MAKWSKLTNFGSELFTSLKSCLYKKHVTAFSTMTVLLRFSFVTMFKPVSLKCSHSGCQSCMEEHVRKAVNPTCPICRAVINDETLSVNIALDNLTKEMPVRCVISGCD